MTFIVVMGHPGPDVVCVCVVVSVVFFCVVVLFVVVLITYN